MGLSLIERYIFRKAMIAVLTAAGALIGVVWLARAIQEVDVVMTKGQNILTYLTMTTLGVPTVTAAIAPLALLIGLLQTLNTLNNDSELIVINAAGGSRKALLKPFMLAGLLTAGLVMFLALWAGPTSMQTLRTFITAMRADLVSFAIREGAFRDVGKSMTFHVASRAPGGVLKGIFILDSRNEKETYTYLAEEGSVSKAQGDAFLVLKKGQIQRRPANSDELSIIQFDSYAFNLSSYDGAKGPARRRGVELSTLELLFPDKSDPDYQKRPERYANELTTRLTAPLYPVATVLIIVALLGFPYSNRQGRWFEASIAALIVIALRASGVVLEGMSLKQPTLLPLLWLLVLAAILIPGVYIWSGRSTGPLRSLRKQLEPLQIWIEDKRHALLSRKKRIMATTPPVNRRSR